MTTRLKPLAFIIAASLGTLADAATISLVPSATSVNQGDTFTVDIKMDFSDIYVGGNGTVGGGIDIQFDTSKLDFQSYSPSGVGDAGFQRNPDVDEAAGTLTGIAAGGLGESDGSNSSPALGATDTIGTITFKVVNTATGTADISANDNTTPAGQFYDFQTNSINTSYLASTVTISSPVLACNGDFDGDGDVDSRDSRVFKADFGRTNCLNSVNVCEGDFDADGDVDSRDSRKFKADFGRTNCPTR